MVFCCKNLELKLTGSVFVVVSFSVSSLRLAYKDLGIQMKDEKMNTSGKNKAEAERLGMGLGTCRR